MAALCSLCGGVRRHDPALFPMPDLSPMICLARTLLTAAMLTGCAHAARSDDGAWRTQLGTIESPALGVVDFPDTVLSGRSTVATVTTIGSSSCTKTAGAQVTIADTVITIVPFDSIVTSAGFCTADIVHLSRAVWIPIPYRSGTSVFTIVTHGLQEARVSRTVVVVGGP